MAQAEALEKLLARSKLTLDAVVEIVVDQAILLDRIETRARQTGGARADDNAETLKRRIAVYRKQTAPVAGFYRRKGRLQQVDGMGAVDVVTTGHGGCPGGRQGRCEARFGQGGAKGEAGCKARQDRPRRPPKSPPRRTKKTAKKTAKKPAPKRSAKPARAPARRAGKAASKPAAKAAGAVRRGESPPRGAKPAENVVRRGVNPWLRS